MHVPTVFLKAFRLHGTGRVELLIAEIIYEIPKAAAGSRLEENGVVALLLEQAGKARSGDAARLEFRSRIQGRLNPAVDRDASLRRARQDHVGTLGEEAALGQLLKKGRRF